MKFKLAAPIAVVMLAAACGGGTTREDAIEELTAVGFEQSTAECLLDDFEAKGYEPSDLEDDSFTPEVEAVFDESLQKCITGADITGVPLDLDFPDYRRALGAIVLDRATARVGVDAATLVARPKTASSASHPHSAVNSERARTRSADPIRRHHGCRRARRAPGANRRA